MSVEYHSTLMLLSQDRLSVQLIAKLEWRSSHLLSLPARLDSQAIEKDSYQFGMIELNEQDIVIYGYDLEQIKEEYN